MKILKVPAYYCTRRSPLAGVFVKDQAQALIRNGVDVSVIFADIEFTNFFRGFSYLGFRSGFEVEDQVPTFRLQGISIPKVHRFFLPLWARNYIPLYKHYVRRYGRPDIIHGHTYWGGYSAMKLSKKFDIPYIVTEHSSEFLAGAISPLNWKSQMIREVYSRAAALIAVSDALRSSMAAFADRPIEVIPNVVNTELFNLKEQERASNGPFHLICVGDLLPIKRFDLAIKALKLLTFKHSEKRYRLTIVGDGPERISLQNLVDRFNLTGKVVFTGELTRENVALHMQNADLLLLTSDFETFGVVLIEAMACGLPVIATKCGGAEGIIDETNGKLVVRNNPEALADTIFYMATTKPKYHSEQIREKVRELYSEKVVSGLMTEIYWQVSE